MTTGDEQFSDTVAMRRAFLEQVAGADHPIRARNLQVPGLDRRAVQKRLERLRRSAGGTEAGDEELVQYARKELSRIASPGSRGLAVLGELGYPEARRFAQEAALQVAPIGDWVELSHSPGDLGWPRASVQVEELDPKSVLGRGTAQSWLAEKKRYLRECFSRSYQDPDLRRNLTPNQLKLDLVRFAAMGTEDSDLCAIQVAPVDWLSCFSLNARLDSPSATRTNGETVRDRWGDPLRVLERRALPGMIVAHIVVETVDRRLLVCQRQGVGLEDERGTWSLSVEERWSGRIHASRDAHGDVVRRSRPPDLHPHDVVKRGVQEELGIGVDDDDIRILAWGLETSVLYPGFIALARTKLGSWEVESLRVQASDPNEVRYVSSVPSELSSVALLANDDFAPSDHPALRARWHRTSKARLFAGLAHILTRENGGGREALIAELGRQ